MQVHHQSPRYEFPGPYDPDSAGDGHGVVSVPPSILERHAGRILRPGQAATLPGMRLQSTVYQHDRLLCPDKVLRTADEVDVVNEELGHVGMELVSPFVEPGSGGRAAHGPYPRGATARVAVLRPRRDTGGVVVDAWRALLRLREAGARNERFDALVRGISLNHLLFAAVPGGDGAEGPPTEGSPDGDDPNGGARVRPHDGVVPVDVLLSMPPRRPLDGRRPVIAMIDTGVSENHLLGVSSPPSKWRPDDFMLVNSEVQRLIRASMEAENKAASIPTDVITDHWERPVSGRPLIGANGRCHGHGTFLSGIVRQVAPDAQVLAIRAMHTDGVVPESALITALDWIRQQLEDAAEGRANAQHIDVVNLALGGYFETPLEKQPSTPLLEAVNTLCDLGVVVVAAAGNDATSRPCYPAALAGLPPSEGSVPIVSVGALNPNGTLADFTNAGPHVNTFATGVQVVSTMPTRLRGDRLPALRTIRRGNPRPRQVIQESLDFDNFDAGWGLWRGTSFSAGLVSAVLGREMVRQSGGSLSLDDPSPAARHRRAMSALAKLKSLTG